MKSNLLQKLTILLFLITINSFAQKVTIKYIESRLVTHQGVEFVGELKDKNHDIYSYDNWNNTGVIFMNNRRYTLSNINFNISTNTFDSRVKRNELFAYKSELLDSVEINGHLFKKVGNAFFEVLFDKENVLFLKKHDLKYKAGTVSRLDGKSGKATVSKVFRYLVKHEDKMTKIELNKRGILSLVEGKDKQEEIENFVKQENLSYKRENEAKQIIEFIYKNKEKLS